MQSIGGRLNWAGGELAISLRISHETTVGKMAINSVILSTHADILSTRADIFKTRAVILDTRAYKSYKIMTNTFVAT